MKYKITETPLVLREYGRNIQTMVEECKKIEDREKRTAMSREIMRVMASLVPQSREGDFRHRLWDLLQHIAGYDLDVDSEYPMPDPRIMNSRPKERMAYNKSVSRFRQYGYNVQQMVRECAKIEDPEKKKALVSLIANLMRIQVGGPEKNEQAEATVIEHLKELSRGKFTFEPSDIHFYKNFAFKSAPRNVTTSVMPRNRKKKKKR